MMGCDENLAIRLLLRSFEHLGEPGLYFTQRDQVIRLIKADRGARRAVTFTNAPQPASEPVEPSDRCSGASEGLAGV
jgi:hypothetical protein